MRHIAQYPCQTSVDNAKSAGELYDAVLANDVYLDFARIFQFFLYAFRNRARKRVHREVRDLAGVYEDAYLPSRRDGVDLLDALKGTRETLEVTETLEIAVDGVPSCSRAAT